MNFISLRLKMTRETAGLLMNIRNISDGRLNTHSVPLVKHRCIIIDGDIIDFYMSE